jgi:E3 ubiquitin-protein ligase EDD1
MLLLLSFRLKEVSEQICNSGYSQSTLFNNLTNVIEAVVSTNYIAFLLEDGRVCRINYNIITDKIESSTTSSNDLSKK